MKGIQNRDGEEPDESRGQRKIYFNYDGKPGS